MSQIFDFEDLCDGLESFSLQASQAIFEVEVCKIRQVRKVSEDFFPSTNPGVLHFFFFLVALGVELGYLFDFFLVS